MHPHQSHSTQQLLEHPYLDHKDLNWVRRVVPIQGHHARKEEN